MYHFDTYLVQETEIDSVKQTTERKMQSNMLQKAKKSPKLFPEINLFTILVY